MEAFLDDNGAIILSTMRKIIRAADQPYPQALPAIRSAVHDVESHKDEPAYMLATILFPVFDQSAAKRAQLQAKADVIRAAALLAWKAKQAAFPETLQEALRSLPADPFDGKPLRYRREGDGFVVYSVGETGKFDGGTAADKPKATETVFRYPMPEWMKKPVQ